jgi:hypothetical protein
MFVNDGHLVVLKHPAKKPKPAIQRLLLMNQPLLRVQGGEREIHRAAAEQGPAVLEDGPDIEGVEGKEVLLVEGGILLLFLLDEAIFGDLVLGGKLVVCIGIIEGRVLDDLAYRLSGSAPSFPFLVPEVGDDAGQKVEQLIGVLLLPVGKLVDSGIPN